MEMSFGAVSLFSLHDSNVEKKREYEGFFEQSLINVMKNTFLSKI